MHEPPVFAAAYAALARFAAPARGRTEVWRILAVLALVVVLTDLAQGVIAQAIRAALGPVFGAIALANLNLGITPLGVVGNLAMALPFGLTLLAALGLVTGRGLGTLLGPPAQLWRDFRAGFAPLAGLGLLLLPLLARDPAAGGGQSLGTLLIWLPLALPLLLAMAAVSEMLFRGFLQQQLAARWGESWVWMGLPSALFALLQGAPAGAGDLAGVTLLWSLCFGMAAADLTARSGSLGAAIGLQAGFQVQSLFLIGLKGPMNGLALYTLDLRGADLAPWMATDFAMLLVAWLGARVILRA